MLLVYNECITEAACNGFTLFLVPQHGEIGSVGYESKFNESRRHCCFPKYIERILPHSPVCGYRTVLHLFLDQDGKIKTLLKMGVLHQLHEDDGLGIVGVKSFISGGIVVLKLDYRVFAFADIEVVFVQILVLPGGLAHQVHAVAVCSAVFGRIDMNGNEKVGAGAVSGYGTVVERDKDVLAAGKDHLDIGTAAPDGLGKFERNVQGEVLLVGLAVAADRPGILTAVACIDDYRPETDIGGRSRNTAVCKSGTDADCK